MEERIAVVCRFRPLSGAEQQTNTCAYLHPDHRTVTLTTLDAQYRYQFDRVFDEAATQEDVYRESAASVVADVLRGYDGCIFAYGSVGTGMTHTMEGPSLEDPAFRGIIPRAVATIFSYASMNPQAELTVHVSYVEIYQEHVHDLLDAEKTDLEIHENRSGHVFVQDVTVLTAKSEHEVLRILRLGRRNRVEQMAVARGKGPGTQPRSHSVFFIRISQRNAATDIIRSSELILVDLAGSERVHKTGSDDSRLAEAKRINKSLLFLNNVIYALSEKSSFIPYRDSKLTRLLQQALGGNTRTLLIIHCSPSILSAVESVATLNFAMRTQRVRNYPTLHESTIEQGKDSLEERENPALGDLLRDINALRTREDDIARLYNELVSVRAGETWNRSDGVQTNTICPSKDNISELLDTIPPSEPLQPDDTGSRNTKDLLDKITATENSLKDVDDQLGQDLQSILLCSNEDFQISEHVDRYNAPLVGTVQEDTERYQLEQLEQEKDDVYERLEEVEQLNTSAQEEIEELRQRLEDQEELLRAEKETRLLLLEERETRGTEASPPKGEFAVQTEDPPETTTQVDDIVTRYESVIEQLEKERDDLLRVQEEAISSELTTVREDHDRLRETEQLLEFFKEKLEQKEVEVGQLENDLKAKEEFNHDLLEISRELEASKNALEDRRASTEEQETQADVSQGDISLDTADLRRTDLISHEESHKLEHRHLGTPKLSEETEITRSHWEVTLELDEMRDRVSALEDDLEHERSLHRQCMELIEGQDRQMRELSEVLEEEMELRKDCEEIARAREIELQRVVESLDEAEELVEKWENVCRAAEEECVRLQEELSSVEHALLSREGDAAMQTEETSSLVREMQDREYSVNRAMEQIRKEVFLEIQYVEDLKSQLQTAQIDHEETKREMRRVEETIIRQRRTIEDLEDLARDKREREAITQEEIRALRGLLNRLEVETDLERKEWTEERRTLLERLARQDDDMCYLVERERISSQAVQRALDDLKRQVSDELEFVDYLKRIASESQQRDAMYAQEFDEHRMMWEEDRNGQREHIRLLEEQLAHKEQDLLDQQQRLASLMDETTARAASMEAAMEQMQREAEESAHALRTLRSSHGEYQETIEALTNKNLSERERVRSLEEQLTRNEQDLFDQQQQSAAFVDETKDCISSMEDAMERMQQEAEESMYALQTLSDSDKEHRETIEALTNENLSERERVRSLEEQLTRNEQDLFDQQQQSAAFMDEMDTRMSSMKVALERMQQKADTDAQTIQELEEELQRTRQELTATSEELHQCTAGQALTHENLLAETKQRKKVESDLTLVAGELVATREALQSERDIVHGLRGQIATLEEQARAAEQAEHDALETASAQNARHLETMNQKEHEIKCLLTELENLREECERLQADAMKQKEEKLFVEEQSLAGFGKRLSLLAEETRIKTTQVLDEEEEESEVPTTRPSEEDRVYSSSVRPRGGKFEPTPVDSPRRIASREKVSETPRRAALLRRQLDRFEERLMSRDSTT